MIKLKIVNTNDYEYECRDELGFSYIMNLEFLDIQERPEKRRLYMYR